MGFADQSHSQRLMNYSVRGRVLCVQSDSGNAPASVLNVMDPTSKDSRI